ncbi:MAG: aldehyde dehydrogenase family protein [Armatimonadetes bacterium]|nr:aldehyde dehydrogenase family protein [Armatimonadota bacterium]
MDFDEKRIQEIVGQVLARIREAEQRPASPPAPSPAGEERGAGGEASGVFEELDAAISAARVAQRELVALGMERRREIIAAVREAALGSAREMAEQARAETRMGNTADKVLKNEYTARLTPGPEVLATEALTGDQGCTLVERAPHGVILAITPSTNPTSTVTNNGIAMVSAGNGVFFSPHPGARECTLEQMRILNRAVVGAGGPANLMTAVADSSLRTVVQAMKHEGIDLISATGGAGVVRAALESGKPAVCAGPGNPPALVDETADLARAARDILRGASYDNNLPCIDEKVVVVVQSVADALVQEMERAGAYVARGGEAGRLAEVCFTEGAPTRELIGQDAEVILDRIGARAAPGTRCIVIEDCPGDCPFAVHEQMMPVLPIVRVPDFEAGVRYAVAIEHGLKHTAAIHTDSVERITRFARAMECTIFVANAPAFAWVGVGAEGWLSQTIAGPTGQGVTDPRTWTRQRMIALGGSLRVV